MKRIFLLVALLVPALVARAESITVATYNIENFREHFLAHRLSTSRPSWMPKNDPQATEVLDQLRAANEEDNWETSQVILDPKFSPDVLAIQEGCSQSDLEYFNKTWLKGAYETVIVFPTNTDREQNVEMLIKPGFKVIDRKTDYYKEPDSVANERGDRLFARGPSFVLIQSPGGYKFWVGTNHQKSKHGNSVEVTKWRNREAARTHAIIKEIEKTGPSDVIFLGDMNDELGMQQYEQEAGGDAIATLVGPPADGVVLLTKPLIDAGQISFGGYSRSEFRSFIDQALATSSMSKHVEKVEVFHNDFTAVSSDHYPVAVHLNSEAVKQ